MTQRCPLKFIGSRGRARLTYMEKRSLLIRHCSDWPFMSQASNALRCKCEHPGKNETYRTRTWAWQLNFNRRSMSIMLLKLWLVREALSVWPTNGVGFARTIWYLVWLNRVIKFLAPFRIKFTNISVAQKKQTINLIHQAKLEKKTLH